jgi:glycogen phosphorylase/synthase
MQEQKLKPDYIFEVSWEVCNKIGGIHTVLSTKAGLLQKEMRNNFILIGPDLWRGDTDNPEFIEDKELFIAWRQAAAIDGLRIRTGRWNIKDRPLAIIIDFTPFIAQKDKILKEMWEKFGLDSITGHWDYVEPVLFGYAVGRLIESFVRFNTITGERILAHFHEWMTGSGILYLRDQAPSVTTVFTTHATVMGRSLAGNYQPLYREFEKYDALSKAREFNIISKYSLEKLSATHADVFTTVSDLTARECRHFLGKSVDVVTPNGFDDGFLPAPEQMEKKRKAARECLKKVAGAVLEKTPGDNVMFVAHSGRYEMKNKGIDVFIYSLAALKNNPALKKDVVAFILIPANQIGPRKELIQFLRDGTRPSANEDRILTHYLHDQEYDPIIQKLQAAGLTNEENDRVKVIFAPCYLNGNDGIFNMPYYDVLMGIDITVFPSYYEPWGYTPMESIAFRIPTITTDLTGYGIWIREKFKGERISVDILQRDDDNYREVVDRIADRLASYSALSAREIDLVRKNAADISRITLWDNLIAHYYDAYDKALRNSEPRIKALPVSVSAESLLSAYKVTTVHEPKWKTLQVHKKLPERLSPLEEISLNLWWSWNDRARDLMCNIDRDLWKKTEGNPVYFLERVNYARYMELEKDQAFLSEMDSVYEELQRYLREPSREGPRIAYFSMEYGLHSCIPIYSGGLGVLAGDYLKEASDSKIDMIAVGLLYKYGYFRQQLAAGGEQIATYEPTDFSHIPARIVRNENGDPLTTFIILPGRKVKALIWRMDVGRIPLYLLDTNTEENQEQDRYITHHLYGGDWENRFKQEKLLGIGGIRALKVLGIKPSLFHCNEGHAAFIGIERLSQYINEQKLVFSQALEVVRASTLFTTHTPVPAGHDSFDESILRTYISHFPAKLNIDWTQFVNLGKIHPEDPDEKFSMSYLAANLSQEMNGVSRLHGKVSRHIFSDLWKGYLPGELHIGYVTNGIHHDTWTSGIWKDFYRKQLGEDYVEKQHLPQTWKPILDAPDGEIWKIRQYLRHNMVEYIMERTKKNWVKKHESPGYYIKIRERFSPNHLIIGFARRFATYKRAQLLFRDLDRLAAIVNNPSRPVQFLFAGKAHPHDKMGQDVMKYIVSVSKRPEFSGKIIFLQNYDMQLAKMLVKGVDVWLNTPTRPLEASGTSGMKAIMNGVLNLSVLDGWWAEGFKPGAGWALPEEQVYDIQEYQDELDADTIYNLIEEEVAPLFYERNKHGVPEKWVKMVKNSISGIAPQFTMRRMLNDYIERYYDRQYARFQKITANNYQLARQLAAWKGRIYHSWERIEVVTVNYPQTDGKVIMLGEEHPGELVLDLKEMHPSSVGVEQVVVDIHPSNGEMDVINVQELQLLEAAGSIARYRLLVSPSRAGAFHYGIRLYPKHPELPHKQDMGFVKWI